MGDTPLNRRTGNSIVRLVLVCFAIQLAVLGYVFYQSYVERVGVVDAERLSCERDRQDRIANAAGWRTAQKARTESFASEVNVSLAEAIKLVAKKPRLSDPPDLIAARRYKIIASGLEERSRVVCSEAFPNASLFP